MFGLFGKKDSLLTAGLLEGSTDNHSHVLYGVDDGVRTVQESLAILSSFEEAGVRKLWLTPHIMEDVPNATMDLQARFNELQAAYKGKIALELGAEYMLDTVFMERLRNGDLLCHGEGMLLVETSTWSPPMDLWGMLEDIKRNGYIPILAHPERYRYMKQGDYERLHSMGVKMQLNLPSIIGVYGGEAMKKAEMLLEKGWYGMTGSDCHRFSSVRRQQEAQVLKSSVVRRLRPLMGL